MATTDDPGSPTIYRSSKAGKGTDTTIHWAGSEDDCLYVKRMKRNGNDQTRPLSVYPGVTTDDLCDECWPEVPEAVRAVHSEEEIENMLLFRGWALGSVTYVGNGDGERIDVAWIELFNGEGRAGEFGGVKAFTQADPGWPLAEEIPGIDGTAGYYETYAFATAEAFEQSGQESGWYVDEWIAPEEPDYGVPGP